MASLNESTMWLVDTQEPDEVHKSTLLQFLDMVRGSCVVDSQLFNDAIVGRYLLFTDQSEAERLVKRLSILNQIKEEINNLDANELVTLKEYLVDNRGD